MRLLGGWVLRGGRGILVCPGVGAFPLLHEGAEGAGGALAELSEEAPEVRGGPSETPPTPRRQAPERRGVAAPDGSGSLGRPGA